MQGINIERLKSDAARLGYHKKPMGDLIKFIQTSIKDWFQNYEGQLSINKEKYQKKIEVLKKRKEEIKKKVGETLIVPETLLVGISGIFLISLLYYVGSFEDTVTALLYLGLGTVGAIIVYLKPVVSDFWKPILFSLLSLLVVVMQSILLYDRGYGYGQAIIFSIPLGILTYLLNENLFNSAFAFMDQSKAIWYRIRLFINRIQRSINHSLKIKNEKKMEALLKRKDLMAEKIVNQMSYEYGIGDLASDIKKKDLTISPLRINGKEHKYAN